MSALDCRTQEELPGVDPHDFLRQGAEPRYHGRYGAPLHRMTDQQREVPALRRTEFDNNLGLCEGSGGMLGPWEHQWTTQL
jgi:hypothetical protein